MAFQFSCLRSARFGTMLLALALTAASATTVSAEPTLPIISAAGSRLVDPAGHQVVLKGCNLGNDLMLESWMFGGSLKLNGEGFKDQTALFTTMTDRFGRERFEHLMDVYRNAYIAPRDFDLIKSFGFNVVRLPFDYRLLQDDAAAESLRTDAFLAIDHVLAMAEAAGVYVILDMHGVPGGQSIQDHTGKAGQNHLWKDTNAQDRTVALWKAVAEHYKDRSVVAAYDLINEPYADFKADIRPGLASLLPRIAEAIRSTGDRHVMYFPGALNGGIGFYGNPHDKKLEGVGFTEHYYPGLFGSLAAMETHARLLGAELPTKNAYMQRIDSPYFVGEFNVVLESEDPNRTMRRYYDRFAEYGWASTMWSYKLIKTGGGAESSAWYMVTNADPLPSLEVATCSCESLEKFFGDLATGDIAVNEALRTELTRPTPSELPLAKYAPLPRTLPSTPQSEPSGFTSMDIGGAPAGHTTALPGDKLQVLGGGTDINALADSFRFVSKPAAGQTEMIITVSSLAESSVWAKAGVMARWGNGPTAAMAMVNAFPDGSVALIGRRAAEGPTTETKAGLGNGFPVQLRLQVADGSAVASYRSNRGDWRPAGTVKVPNEPDFRMGLAVCSHAEDVLNPVTAVLGAAGDEVLPVSPEAEKADAAPSLLPNGSFEEAGASADVAAGWNRWGDWLNREDSWTPTHEGKCLIGYHHWQIEGKGGSSGLFRDVKVKVGQRYTFSIFAQHDKADAGAHEAKSLELRLESVKPDAPVALNSRQVPISGLATGKEWTKVSVSGTATSDTLRVLAVIDSSTQAERGGAVKLDDATLTIATDGK